MHVRCAAVASTKHQVLPENLIKFERETCNRKNVGWSRRVRALMMGRVSPHAMINWYVRHMRAGR